MSQSTSQIEENKSAPHVVTRGEKPSNAQTIFIDFLSYTSPGGWGGPRVPELPPHFLHGVKPQWVPNEVIAELCFLNEAIPYGLRVVYQDKGWMGYQFHATLHRDNGQNGLIAWGGNSGTYHVSLSGSGCVMVDPNRMADHIEEIGASVRRLDIALDDHSQTYTGGWAMDAYNRGEFNAAHGRRPSYNPHAPNGVLETLEIGKRKHGKMLRVYDKSIEQGYGEEKRGTWWRVELEWRASARRVIPVEALRNPASYFAGSYPGLNRFAEVAVVVKTIARVAKGITEATIKHARIQYGKLWGWLHQQGLTWEEIGQSLMREGTPSGIGKTLLCGVAI